MVVIKKKDENSINDSVITRLKNYNERNPNYSMNYPTAKK